jgi:hypothetical protein
MSLLSTVRKLPEPNIIKSMVESQAEDMDYENDEDSMIAVDETGRRMSDCDQEEDEEPPLCYKQTCRSHLGQLVLAFNKKTLEYLCTKCIEK